VKTLKSAGDYANIYLPDFKYSDASLAAALSKCRNYPRIALEAIAEMVSQKRFLDSFLTGATLARRGALVRYLILPGKVTNSINALTPILGKGC